MVGAQSGLRLDPEQQEIAPLPTCAITFQLSILNGTEGYQISGKAGGDPRPSRTDPRNIHRSVP